MVSVISVISVVHLFLPDGRWISYQTNESGRYEIAVRAFPPDGRFWQVSAGGGTHARWSRNGKEWYYLAPDDTLMAVPVNAINSAFRTGPPVRLFTPTLAEGSSINAFNTQYDVARDGRFLINISLGGTTTAPITLISNWKSPAR